MYDPQEREKWYRKVCQWKRSEEYAAINDAYIEECATLAERGIQWLAQIPALSQRIAHSETRVEYASGADIHRGYYCPSPVITYLIGNVHRGRLLKRVSARSNLSNKYVFSSEGRLLCAERYKCSTVETEYIIEQGNIRYGITVDGDMQLAGFSIETFENSVLHSYTLLELMTDFGEPLCVSLCQEEYTYDEEGLLACDRRTYDALIGSFSHCNYMFERKNGVFSSYTMHDYSLPEYLRDEYSVMKYYIRPKK